MPGVDMSGVLAASIAARDPRLLVRSARGCAGSTRELPHDRTSQVDVSIVIPTTGRASLGATLRSLVDAAPDERIILHLVLLVDERGPGDVYDPMHPPPSTEELRDIANAWLGDIDTDVAVTRSGGRSPALARNLGIASTTTPWVAVLDDDVIVCDRWWHALADDLVQADPAVGGVFAQLDVRPPEQRWTTHAERPGGRLATDAWMSTDVALRRAAVEEIGGFVDGPGDTNQCLVLRLLDAGWRPSSGSRRSRTIRHLSE